MKIKKLKTRRGEKHFSVGAIIRKNKKILIINRKLQPPGFAAVAGHIDKGESSSQALEREIKEETNLRLEQSKLVLKRLIVQQEDCTFKSKIHQWYVYECSCSGRIKPQKKEVKSISYLSIQEIRKLHNQKKLEYAWQIIFKRLRKI